MLLLRVRVGLGAMGYTTLSKALALRKPHNQVFLCYIQSILWGSLKLLQTYSRCILQILPTGPSITLVVGVVLLYRDAIGVFYSLSRLGQPVHSLGESHPSAEMQLVYSEAPVDWGNYDVKNHWNVKHKFTLVLAIFYMLFTIALLPSSHVNHSLSDSYIFNFPSHLAF